MSSNNRDIDAAYDFVDAMVPRADASGGAGAPLWYGWALRDAFIAGAKWEQERLTAENTRLRAALQAVVDSEIAWHGEYGDYSCGPCVAMQTIAADALSASAPAAADASPASVKREECE